MATSILMSPAIITSAAITLAAGGYSYVYLPLQMRKAYRQSLLTLASAVETKDVSSIGHGKRVAELVVATAREMRISNKKRTKMEYAAFLQDIGNVRVPHSILNRADALTQEELDIVKAHTTIGSEMVEQVTFLKDMAPIVRHHHEHWDGSGYPDGLKGEQIPLGARIISVCTAYDAMVHQKTYRPAIDLEEAITTIRGSAGAKFDPTVVDAFLRALKKTQREENKLL